MRKSRSLSFALAPALVSALAFAVVTPEQIKNAILGVKVGVMVLVGNCEGQDQYKIQELLTLIRGCQMTDKDAESTLWNKQKHCIDSLIHKWESIEQVQCKAPLQRPTERLLVKNLLKQWDWVKGATARDILETRVNSYLEHLSYWENTTRKTLYLAADVSEVNGLDEFYQDLSQDLNEVHAKMASGLFNSMRTSIADFDEFQTKKFMEKEPPFYMVMKGLFKQDKPGPISLINFTAMTLNPLLERAKIFLTLFDLTCSLKGICRHEDYAYSESYLVLLLSSWIGETTLDGPILKDSLSRLHPGAKKIFETLFQDREKLVQALRVGMANQEVAISEASLEQFEPLALYFVSQLKETNQRLQTVKKTGRFVLVEKEYLGPFTQECLDQVNQVLIRLRDLLDVKLTRYSAGAREQLNALEHINEGVNRKENTASQLDSIRLELSMAEMDLQGLQTALRREGDTVSKLMLRSSHLISNEAYQNRFSNGNLSPIFSGNFNVSARDAKFNPVGTRPDIQSLAVTGDAGRTLRIPLKKGDLVSAAITGQYSPTCAIAKEYLKIEGLEGSLTGPEGFMVSSSDRHLQVSSASQTTGDRQSAISTDQHTQHLKGCGSTTLGASVSVQAGFNFIVEGSVSVSASVSHSSPDDCTDNITSKTKSTEISQMNSKTSSSEFNQQASFERGMRSPFTPFPNLPVGALVGVELDLAHHQVTNTRVLHRNTVFPATQDADLILVINDCINEQAPRSPLGVKLTQSRSALNESAVGFLMESIASISDDLQRRLPTFIDQGELSSADLAVIERALRDQINAHLITGRFGAFQISDFPLIEEMFQTWISTELAQLQRRVKIRQVERKIQLLVLRHDDLVNQSLSLDRAHIIREMISDSTFRSLDFRELLAEVLRVVEFLDYRVLPVLETVKPGLAKSVSNEFNTFVHSLDLNSDLESVGKKLVNLVDSLDFAQALQIRARAQANRRLVMSFPRTVPRDGEDPKYREEWVDGKKEYRSDSSWAAVSYTESNRVWHDFLASKNELSFNVSEKDIYNPNALFGALNCRQRAPFVSAMGVFFVVDRDQHMRAFNALGPKRQILLPDVVSIPNLAGMESYRVTSEAFRSDSVPIRVTTEMQVLPIFDESLAIQQHAANGISPIGTFTLQGMNEFYRNPMVKTFFNEIDEILLVFQYDSLSSDRNLSWIPGCY